MISNKFSIVLIENNIAITQAYQELMPYFDIDLKVVPDSYQALNLLNQFHIGRLPLDIFLTCWPCGFKSFNIIEKIRNLPNKITIQGGVRIKNIPIIVIPTFTCSLDNYLKFLKPDPSNINFITKPFIPRQLFKIIDEMVRKYREHILSDLHRVGLGLTWDGGKYKIYPCYTLKRRSGSRTRYININNSSSFHGVSDKYYHLTLIQDKYWSAEFAIQEFEWLINSHSTKELDFQNFFKLHPEFLYQNCCIDHWTEPRLKDQDTNKMLKPDFIFKSIFLSNRPWSWQIVDLKRHTAPLLTNKNFHPDFSRHVYRVVTQLRDYSEYFDNPNNREKIKSKFGGIISKPKLVAVIGRLPSNEQLQHYTRLKSRMLDVCIMTYDEILEFRKCQVERRSCGFI